RHFSISLLDKHLLETISKHLNNRNKTNSTLTILEFDLKISNVSEKALKRFVENGLQTDVLLLDTDESTIFKFVENVISQVFQYIKIIYYNGIIACCIGCYKISI